MKKIKLTQLGLRPNKIFALKDNMAIIKSADEFCDKIKKNWPILTYTAFFLIIAVIAPSQALHTFLAIKYVLV